MILLLVKEREDMDCLFELLFLAWCKGYEPEEFPTAHNYGLYAFREGLRLGLSLTAGCLWDWLD